MTNFNHDFSKIKLLANFNIVFKNEEKESFELIPMKVKDVYFNSDLAWFLNLIEQDIDELIKFFPNVEIQNHYEFIMLVLTIGERKEELKDIADLIIESLNILVPGIIFKNKQLKIYDIVVDQILFEQIIEVIYKIMGKKEPIKINDTDDEMTRRMKETQRKIQEIKSKGKKMDGKTTDFEDMFAAIIYEFPQYKIEDLFDLNIYTFYYLFKYVGKIANYEVSKIAAGNGLSKKHKYFIEK